MCNSDWTSTNFGGLVTGAGPAYSVAWNTTSDANGPHTLTAVADDAAGNTGTSSITVTVTNAVTSIACGRNRAHCIDKRLSSDSEHCPGCDSQEQWS